MGRKRYEMTWVSDKKTGKGRWRKKYQGKQYYFPFGKSKSDLEGYRLALEAWQQTKARIDIEKPNREQYERAISVYQKMAKWQRANGDRTGLQYSRQAIKELKSTLLMNPEPPELANFEQNPLRAMSEAGQAIWAERFRQMDRDPEPSTTPQATPRTIGEAIEQLVTKKRNQARKGLRSATRAENLRIHLGELERYLGTGFLLQRIDANTVNGYHEHLMAEIDKKKKSPRYVYEHWASFRQLIRWLYDNEFIEKQPRNLNSQDNDFPKATTRIRTISKEVYRLLVSEATDTTKLYLLLCLNCGMTQSDIAALRHDEVDWETGRITRKRTKTKDKTNVPTVSYPLWPCTFELLKEWRSEHAELVLVNRNGEPLKFEVIDDDDRHKKNDNIHNAFKRLIDRLTKQEKLEKRDRPTLKLIRKTGATALGSHPTYLALTSHYLGHAPVSMAEKYYANPPQRLVDEAINWLGTEFEVMGPEET